MDFAFSDIAISDVGVHVVSSLAAFIVVDFYKSVFSRDRAARRGQENAVASGQRVNGRKTADERSSDVGPARRSWLSLLIGWIFLFVFKVVVKAILALLAAGLAISWLQSRVDLATAYRLSADSAETLLGAAFFLVLVLAWWILPIRLFKR